MPTEDKKHLTESAYKALATVAACLLVVAAVVVWRSRPHGSEARIQVLLRRIQDPKTSKQEVMGLAEEALSLEEKAHGHQGDAMALGLHLMLAESFTRAGEHRKAIPHWEALLADGSKNPADLLFVEGRLSAAWMALEDWPKAREHGEAVLAIARKVGLEEKDLLGVRQDLDKIKLMERKQPNGQK